MIALLIILLHLLPEIGIALLVLWSWMAAGWHFSLSAAPAAYHKYIDKRKKEITPNAESAWVKEQSRLRIGLGRLDRYGYMGPTSDQYDSDDVYKEARQLWVKQEQEYMQKQREEAAIEKKAFIAKTVSELTIGAENNAFLASRLTGKKCIRRGPFAYFLTPQWNNKLTVAWTPAEVTAQNLIVSTGETLNKVKELGAKTEIALDLGDYKNMDFNKYRELMDKVVSTPSPTLNSGEKVVPDLKELQPSYRHRLLL